MYIMHVNNCEALIVCLNTFAQSNLQLIQDRIKTGYQFRVEGLVEGFSPSPVSGSPVIPYTLRKRTEVLR